MESGIIGKGKLARAQAVVLVGMLIISGGIVMAPSVLADGTPLFTPHPIAGYVHDDTGPAMSGVTVRVTNPVNGEFVTDVTDALGRYDVDLQWLTSGYLDGGTIYVTTPEPNQGFASVVVDIALPYQWANITVDRTDPVIGATSADKLFINNQGTYGGIAPPTMITVADVTDNVQLAGAAWGIRQENQWEGTMYFTCDITDETMPATYGWDGNWYHLGLELVTAGTSPANGGTDLFVFGEVNGTMVPGDELGNSLPTHYVTFQPDGTFQAVYSTEGTPDYTDDMAMTPGVGGTFRAFRYDEGAGFVATAYLATYTVDPWVADLTISAVPDGRYAICTSAMDAAGNAAWTNETTGNPVITVDNFPPIATATGPATSDVQAFNIAYTYTADPAPSSGLQNVSLFYSYNGGAWRFYGTEAALDGSFAVNVNSIGGDGTYDWCLVAFDNTGNREDAAPAIEATTLVDSVAPTIGATSVDKLYINNQGTFGGIAPPVMVTASAADTNLAAAGWAIRDELSWEGTMYFSYDLGDGTAITRPWDGNRYLIGAEIVTVTMSDTYGIDKIVYGEYNGANATGHEIGNNMPSHYAVFSGLDGSVTLYATHNSLDVLDHTEIPNAGLSIGDTFRAYRYDEGHGYVATAAVSTFATAGDLFWINLASQPVPDGRYAVCVSAIDWAQNSAWTNETTPNPVITVDSFAPVATATGPAISNVQAFNIAYTYTADPAPSSGLQNVSLFYSYNGGAWRFYGTEAALDGSFAVNVNSIGGDGTYDWCLVAFDNTGNREDAAPAIEATTLVDTLAPNIGATGVDKLYINNQGTFGGIAPPVQITTTITDDNLAAGGWGIRAENQWEGTIYFTCDITEDVMPATHGWDGMWYHLGGELVTAGISPANAPAGDLFVFGEVNGVLAPGDELGNNLPSHYVTFQPDGTLPVVYSTEGTLDYTDDAIVTPILGDTFRAYRYDEGAGYVATAYMATYTLDPWVADLTISPVPDGRYAVCVSAIDWAQNSAWTNETTPNPVITVDNFAPDADATGPATSTVYIFDVTYTWIADPAPSSGLLNTSLWYNKGSGWVWFDEDPTPEDGFFPVDLTALGDGTYQWFMASFDMAHNHEALLFTAEATTVVDTTSPVVVATTPANGAVDIALAAGTYVIQFSEPMDTGVGAVTTDLPGAVWTWSVNRMWLNGTYTGLTESTTYNVDLSGGGFADLLGNALIEGAYGWTFSFATVNIPPEVVATTPANGAVDIALAAGTYVIQFSEPMDIGVGAVTTDLPGAVWTWSANGMWLNGTYTGLTESTTYTVDLSAGGFADLHGNVLIAGAYGWAFTFDTVNIPPTILSTVPTDGQNGVALNQAIVITFDEPMDTATLTYTCVPALSGVTVAWSAGDTVLTLTHNDFAQFTGYMVTVSYIEDVHGNALVAGAIPNPWTFTAMGSFTLSYQAGWNLFGIPVLNPTAGGVPVTNAYNITQAGALMVSKWNFATQRYANFIAGFHMPGEAQDFALLPDEAYWAWMPSAGSLVLDGALPGTRNVAVNGPGWNMIAYMDPVIVGDVETDWAPYVSCGAFDDIAYYDGATFQHYIFTGTVMQLVPGLGYFVWSDAPSNIAYSSPAPGPIQNADTGATYWSIQDAIDGATPGETVNVGPGTYNENIVIDRPMILNGAGSGIFSAHGSITPTKTIPVGTTITGVETHSRDSPIIDGADWSGNVVTITSDDVTFSGFQVSNSGTDAMDAGVYLDSAWYCIISDIWSTSNMNGFVLASSDMNQLTDNEASGNAGTGMLLTNSNDNEIYHDIFSMNGIQASDDAENSWSMDLPDGGNYWDDWVSPDANSDGVVDIARDIVGDGMQTDDHPWTTRNGWDSPDLAVVADGTSLTGDLTNMVAAFPATVPAFFDTAGYFINSEIVLAGDVDGDITITRDGVPMTIVGGLAAGTYTYTQLVALAYPIPEPAASPFNNAIYGGAVETYTISVANNPAAIDTTVTVRSIISNDGFATRTVLAELIDLPLQVAGSVPLPVQNTNTGETFATIQAAIDDADTLDGHTITVAAGTFNEALVIDKQLMLIGAGTTSTILNVDGVISINEDHVSMQGFQINHVGWGSVAVHPNIGTIDIGADGIPHHGITMVSNLISAQSVAIYMDGVTDSIIASNEIYVGPDAGIFVTGFSLTGSSSGNLQIVGNSISGGMVGLRLEQATIGTNVIAQNYFSGYMDYAVYVQFAVAQIYNNNFMDMPMSGWQAYSYTSGLPVAWDMGAPGTGNYWNGFAPIPNGGTGQIDHFPLSSMWP